MTAMDADRGELSPSPPPPAAVERIVCHKCHPREQRGGGAVFDNITRFQEHYARRHLGRFHLFCCKGCTAKFVTVLGMLNHLKTSEKWACRPNEDDVWYVPYDLVPLHLVDGSKLDELQSAVRTVLDRHYHI